MDDYSEMHKLQFDKEFPLDWIVRNSTDFQKELFHEFMRASLLPNFSLYLYDFLGITGVEWLELYDVNQREESKITDRSGYKECIAPTVPVSDFDEKQFQARSAFNSEIVNNTLNKKYFVPDLLNTNIVKVFTKLQIELERFRKALFIIDRSIDKEVTETAKNIHLIIEQLQPQFINHTLDCLIKYISEMSIFTRDSIESTRFDTAKKSLILELNTKNDLKPCEHSGLVETKNAKSPKVAKKRNKPLLLEINEERLKPYFSSSFKGSGNSLNYFSTLIEELKKGEFTPKEIALVARMILKSKHATRRVGIQFDPWYETFSKCLGVDKYSFQPKDLRKNPSNKILTLFNYLEPTEL